MQTGATRTGIAYGFQFSMQRNARAEVRRLGQRPLRIVLPILIRRRKARTAFAAEIGLASDALDRRAIADRRDQFTFGAGIWRGVQYLVRFPFEPLGAD